jgi:hypothetical protein
MTKNQKIKYFGTSDPEKKKNLSTEERVNEFLARFNQRNRNCDARSGGYFVYEEI